MLGVPLEAIERRSAILLNGRQIPYPFQYNLWALGSRSLIRSAIADLECAHKSRNGSPSSLAEVLESAWGSTCLALFLRPYNEKLWGRPLEDLPPDCAGGYLPLADLALARQGALRRVRYPGYNGTFLYPVSGRLGDLMNAMATPIRRRIHFGKSIVAVDLERHELVTCEGDTISYDCLVSTIPLERLLRMSGIEPDDWQLFDATEIANVRIGLRGAVRTRHHWVYVTDQEFPFHRIGFPGNVNPRTCPDAHASLSIEYTVPARGPAKTTDAISTAALECVQQYRLVDVDECLTVTNVRISPAYVLSRAPGRPKFDALRRLLERNGVRLAGRFGAWDYFSIEDAFVSGISAGRSCLIGRQTSPLGRSRREDC
jgi:protoporphyrinogen oxidase